MPIIDVPSLWSSPEVSKLSGKGQIRHSFSFADQKVSAKLSSAVVAPKQPIPT